MLLMLNCSGNVLVKLMNQQAVKIGKTGTKKLLTLNLKNVRICCIMWTIEYAIKCLGLLQLKFLAHTASQIVQSVWQIESMFFLYKLQHITVYSVKS